MYSAKQKKESLGVILGYTLPTLHKGKNWYIDFASYDPISQRMKRKKYMLNRYKNISDRKKIASEIIANLSIRLRSGWSPWISSESDRKFIKLSTALDLYYKYLDISDENRTMKHNTILDYRKRLKVFIIYNNLREQPIEYTYQFDRAFVSDFLDYVLIDRGDSARTRNNYKTWLSTFGSWLLERQYIDSNPASQIKSLAVESKKRSDISQADLRKLDNHLKETNPHFLLLCKFLYYTLIRPGELSSIKLKDIHLKDQKVYIASTVSKNRNDGMVGLNDNLIGMMIDLHVFENDQECYLFGKDFKPSPNKCDSRVYRTYFNRVRTELNFPKSYQLYSLKDSGINDLANSKGIVVARDQARHADISTTNKYLNGKNIPVHEETKHFDGHF